MKPHRSAIRRHAAAAVIGAVAGALVLTLTVVDTAAAGGSITGRDVENDPRYVTNKFAGNSDNDADFVVDHFSPLDVNDDDDRSQYDRSRDADAAAVEGSRDADDFLEPSGVKRNWGQKNMALWGKRGHLVDGLRARNDVFRRNWGQKNMALWGKRSGYANASGEKRKWGQKNMALWGRK